MTFLIADCQAPNITEEFAYYWFDWDRDASRMTVGSGTTVGVNEIVTRTYSYGDVNDFSLRDSITEYGMTEYIIHPDAGVIATNRQPIANQYVFNDVMTDGGHNRVWRSWNRPIRFEHLEQRFR